MYRLGLASTIAVVTQAATDKKYVYDNEGADWGEDFPLCKSGKEQSPINLTIDAAERSEAMELNGYGYRDF